MTLARCLVLLLAFVAAPAAADEWLVQVADPYLELRSGPGRSYPVIQTAERGETVAVLKRRTAWYKVRTGRERTGWAHRDDIARTLDEHGEPLRLEQMTLEAMLKHRWRTGISTGDFGGANAISLTAGFAFSPNLSVELGVTQALGPFAENLVASASLVHQFMPRRRLTPFFSLTGGVIRTDPKATLVLTEDRQDELAAVGAGVRAWLTRRFVFRAEYRSYVVFTSRNDNEEIDEWKAGFTFFF